MKIIVNPVRQNGKVYFIGRAPISALALKMHAPQMDFSKPFEEFCDDAYDQTKPGVKVVKWQRPEDGKRVAKIQKWLGTSGNAIPSALIVGVEDDHSHHVMLEEIHSEEYELKILSDDALIIIDGQHRFQAFQSINGIKNDQCCFTLLLPENVEITKGGKPKNNLKGKFGGGSCFDDSARAKVFFEVNSKSEPLDQYHLAWLERLFGDWTTQDKLIFDTFAKLGGTKAKNPWSETVQYHEPDLGTGQKSKKQRRLESLHVVPGTDLQKSIARTISTVKSGTALKDLEQLLLNILEATDSVTKVHSPAKWMSYNALGGINKPNSFLDDVIPFRCWLIMIFDVVLPHLKRTNPRKAVYSAAWTVSNIEGVLNAQSALWNGSLVLWDYGRWRRGESRQQYLEKWLKNCIDPSTGLSAIVPSSVHKTWLDLANAVPDPIIASRAKSGSVSRTLTLNKPTAKTPTWNQVASHEEIEVDLPFNWYHKAVDCVHVANSENVDVKWETSTLNSSKIHPDCAITFKKIVGQKYKLVLVLENPLGSTKHFLHIEVI